MWPQRKRHTCSFKTVKWDMSKFKLVHIYTNIYTSTLYGAGGKVIRYTHTHMYTSTVYDSPGCLYMHRQPDLNPIPWVTCTCKLLAFTSHSTILYSWLIRMHLTSSIEWSTNLAHTYTASLLWNEPVVYIWVQSDFSRILPTRIYMILLNYDMSHLIILNEQVPLLSHIVAGAKSSL
jgi:hypothetical protein